MKVRLTPRAARDVEDIAEYLIAENPYAPDRGRGALQKALSLLADYPFAAKRHERDVRRLSMTSHPYLIFYRVDEAVDEIAVLSIRHAARRSEG